MARGIAPRPVVAQDASEAVLRVVVPLCPDPDLSPNARVHWRAKAAAVKNTRLCAKACTMNALGATIDEWADWLIRPPNQRFVVDAVIAWGAGRKRMDQTNLNHCLKPYLDGVADALGVNDKLFAWGEVRQERAPKGDGAGSVVIEVRPIEEATG